MDYHFVLGTTTSSTLKEIKGKFRTQVLKKHLDHGGPDDEMKILGEAYHILSDPDRRFLYENKASNNKSYVVWSQEEFNFYFFQNFKKFFLKFMTK